MLEQVRKRVRDRDHYETYPYGNFAFAPGAVRGPNATPSGWDTHEGFRYGTNLAGMSRISILSEAMSHDPFPRRIASSYAFILESMA